MNYHMNFPSSNGRAAQDVGGGDEGNLYWDVVAEPQDLRLDELLDLGLDETPDLGLPLVFMLEQFCRDKLEECSCPGSWNWKNLCFFLLRKEAIFSES